MIDWCPLFSKSRSIDVSCRLLIPYYFSFHYLTWFELPVVPQYFDNITRA